MLMQKYISSCSIISKIILTVFLGFFLSSCSSNVIEFELYGKDNKCYQSSSIKDCTKLKLYDTVKLSINQEKQSASYVRNGYKLDETNTVFDTLDNCKIIDKNNFRCENISRVNGKFSDVSLFKDMQVSESFLVSIYIRFKTTIDAGLLASINEFHTMISIGVGILFILVLLGSA